MNSLIRLLTMPIESWTLHIESMSAVELNELERQANEMGAAMQGNRVAILSAPIPKPE